MAKQRIADKKEKMNPLLWFLFAIIIPIIIAGTLTVVVFAMAGVNVIDWAKNTGNNIPILSSFITTEEEKNENEKQENTQSLLDTKDAEIEQLEAEKANLEGTITKLESEIAQLEDELIDIKATKEETEQSINQITSSFSEMDHEQAALIIEQLDHEAAFRILKKMSNENRGLILGNMNPSIAAEITKRFIKLD